MNLCRRGSTGSGLRVGLSRNQASFLLLENFDDLHKIILCDPLLANYTAFRLSLRIDRAPFLTAQSMVGNLDLEIFIS